MEGNILNCGLHGTFLHLMNGNGGYNVDCSHCNLVHLASCSYDENHKSHVNQNVHNVSPEIFVLISYNYHVKVVSFFHYHANHAVNLWKGKGNTSPT